MKLLVQRDFWSGVLFTAAGAAFLVLAQQNPLGTAADMGPAYFPSLVAILLVAVGVVSCVRAVWASEAIDVESLRPLAAVVAATAVFGFLLDRLGLLLATGALVAIGAFARPAPGLVETALLAAALMTIGAIVFVWGLGVMLPLLPNIG